MGRTDPDVLVGRAWEALRAGGEEDSVCADLARRTGDPRAAALATCLALGMPRTEAEQRLATGEAASVLDELGSGDEAAIALVLQAAGVFVVDRELAPYEQRILDLLRTAADAYGSAMPSGLCVSLGRWFRGGELARAYLQLASPRRRVRPDGSLSAYWAALVAAGELLPDGDGMEEAREHCRRKAERHPGEP